MRRLLFLFLGSILLASPLMAYERLCPNAKPGCGGKCHGDANLQKCPKPSPPTQPKPPSSTQAPKPKLDQGLKLFFGLDGLKGLSLNH